MRSGATTGEVHLVSHTHWDREWYQTREHFRLRLVDLIDRVLELLETGTGYAFFHLDGQTIVLEDYLEIRPEREPRLKALIAEGRLLVGPWYVMPDEFLVSPESLVRNLALGQRIANAFGGSMPVGYLPDLFGHVGQMPQILRGFGLDNAVLWRGFAGRAAEYWWEAPDGSRVLMMHLPGEGYCNATRVALVPEQMVERTERVMMLELQRSRFGIALLMNGVDHVEPQAEVPSLVATLKDRGWQVAHSTLSAYVAAVRRAAGRDPRLETIAGELRGGEDYAPLLPGVLSARVYLKQANARAQRALERWAEPLSALAWPHGSAYPHGALQYAWKTLLQNHPHDSICGCSIDAVHDENMTRFARAQQVADDLSNRAASAIGATLAPPAPGFLRTIVFNTSGQVFSGVVDLTLDVPYESDEPSRHVDPEALDYAVTFWPRTARPISASAADGTTCAFQVLDEADAVAFVLSRYETPWALRVRRFRLAVELSNVPGFGYVPVDWRISEAEPAEAPPGGPDGRHASNGLLALTLNADGTVDVTDARTGMVHSRCGALLDEGDVGDEYTYSPPARDTRVTSAQSSDVQILRVHNGPLRHTFAIDATLRVPVRAACDRRERVAETTALRVSTLVTLDRGADFVKWQVTVENNAEDHRLRIMFPAGASRPEFAIADSAFGVVQRPTTARSQASLEKPVEAPVAYAPLQTFVAVADAQRGMAVIADGLAEYEVLDDGTPQLAITLLRAVGALSRDDLSTRPHGHAGPGLATPGAQCLGTHTFRLAAASVAGEVDPRALYATAARVLTPPRAWTQAASGGRRASSMSVVQIQGDVVLSACKRADDREALVLRYFNPSAHVASIQIQLAKPIREAYLLNLREERQETLATVGGALQRRVRPHGIETIEVSSP